MCGIAGFRGDWSSEHLAIMKQFLFHRGPDDSGVYFNPASRIGLAHTRLSIIDVTGGHQPLQNSDGTIRVIFNGEIYNHKDLRRELKTKGYTLPSHSDGEVISHLYQEFGINFVSKLRGMFAIAIWDERNRKLYLIRDRFGIKPLYFQDTNKGLLFASEAKAILGVSRVREIDPQALEWYTSFRYVPEDRTMFKGIRKLRPAHWLEYSDKGMRIERYWDLRDTKPDTSRTEAQWADELKSRLREAIDIRLMSEVPLGAFLSGGLDSSFIVGLMSELIDNPVETFSFGVGTGWHNETSFAEQAASAFNTSHHPLSGDCNDPELLKQIMWYMDEPLGDTAVIPTYLLSQLTRKHVTVALTGEGADELLGGYDKYKVLTYGDQIGRWLPSAPLNAFSSLVSKWHKPYRALRFLSNSRDRARAYMELVAVFSDREKQNLYASDTCTLLNQQEPAYQVINRILEGCHGPTYLDDLLHIDLQTWLPDDVLLKADKMTMAHALEGRVPFLDHKFAEFCASMPASLKIKGWREKHILREAMRGLVPEEIVNRKKHGFTVSLKPWATPTDNTVREILSEKHVKERGWFNYATVNRLLNGNLDNQYVRRQVTSLLVLETWAETFIDPATLTPLTQIKN
jgi:asparagine synthase (glutamine-hydrolysing)